MSATNFPDGTDDAHVQQPCWVIGLCAQWCGVCREYEPLFRQLAGRFPQARFAWLDVEDEDVAAALGEHDVETFPCVVAGCGERLFFNGPVLPQAGVLERMLQGWLAEAQAAKAGRPQSDEQALLRRLVQLLSRKPEA